jgi:pimeloyl-ACP methyl ester carboxylesterase
VDVGARWAIALCVAVAPNAWRLLPQEKLELPPELARRGATRVELQVGPPAATLAAWLIEPRTQPPRGSILLLHGIRQDRRSLVGAGTAFADAGYRSILVDLRGHGESSGHFLTYGAVEARDLSQLLDALSARGLELGCVGAFGFSYGAAVAIELGASDRRLGAVVAAAPFSSLRDVVSDYRREYLPAPLNAIPDSWFAEAVTEAGWLASFDPDQSSPLHALAASRAHLLLIHGSADTQIPLRHSVALSSAAGPLAELLTIPGAAHYSLPPGLLHQRALGWFQRWLDGGVCREHATALAP